MDLNYKVVYTDSAIDDLNSILSYLNGYGNPNILIHFKKEISNKLEVIKSFPQSYRVIFRQHGYKLYLCLLCRWDKKWIDYI